MKVRKTELLRYITQGLEADAFMAYSPQWHKENYRFLTENNFIGPFGIVLYLGVGEEVHVIYGSQWDVNKNAPLLEGAVCHGQEPYETIHKLLKDAGVKRLAVSGGRYLPGGFLRLWRRQERRSCPQKESWNTPGCRKQRKRSVILGRR